MSVASNSSSTIWSKAGELAASKSPVPRADPTSPLLVAQNYAFVLEACGQICGKRVLDVGFGNGDLARILDRMGGLVTALDIVSTRIAQLREDAPTVAWRQADIATWKQPRHADPFDLIVACETLQFVEFHNAIGRLLSVLSCGGRIVVQIPNADCPVVATAGQEFPNEYPGISMKSLNHRLRNLTQENYVAYRGIYAAQDSTVAPYQSGPWHRILPDASPPSSPHFRESHANVAHRIQVVILRPPFGAEAGLG